MSTGTWHADDALLRSWSGGAPDVAAGASVEAHLLHCARCRARLAELRPPAGDPVLDRAWSGVVAGIAVPPPSPAVRLLRRLGVSASDAVLLRAARSAAARGPSPPSRSSLSRPSPPSAAPRAGSGSTCCWRRWYR